MYPGQVAGRAIGLIASGVHRAEEAGHIIAEGLAEAVERVGELRHQGVNEPCLETFFDAVCEDEQVRVMCSTGTHPDPLLRRLGIIEGRGIVRGEEVYFNALKGQWVYQLNNKEVQSLTRGEAAINHRRDKAPKGVIYVTGELPKREEHLEDHEKAKKAEARSVVRRIKETKMKVRGAAEKAGGPTDRLALQDDDDYYGELTTSEKDTLFRQYLSTGVVEAARKSESCIITKGSGEIATSLSNGVFTTQDKGVSGGFPTSGIRTNHTMLVGITKYTEDFKADCLDKRFTHQIVVDRDTRPCNKNDSNDLPLVKSAIEELEEDGLHDEAKRARRQTDQLLDAEMPTQVFTKKQCRGFRCRHVDVNYRPIVADGRRAVHCRIRGAGGVIDVNDEDDVTREMRLAVHRKMDQAFVDQIGLNVWKQCCERLCECGYTLTPYEVAQCVCGRYDFEHIPREAKRVRYLSLANTFADNDLTGKQDILTYLAFMQCPVTRIPTDTEVVRFTDGILTTITKGFSSETDMGRTTVQAPPNRAAAPLVTILFGGDTHIDKLQLARHVQHRWPILVVEGTGGYADTLCGIVNKVKEIVASQSQTDAGRKPAGGKRVLAGATVDEFRKFLTKVDSLTAEIIVNGRLSIIHKGTKTTEFSRKLEISLNGNETLEKAWFLHAQWAHNAEIQQTRYLTYHWVFNILSLLTVLLSVIQTFLLLTADTEPAALPTHRSFKNVVTTSIVWIVIILPVVISFVQAVALKDKAGAKSIQLQNAAEKLLSEIYMYRTWTLAYSPVELQKQLDLIATDADQGERYTTREELLQIKSKELTDSLSESSVAGATLHQYSGPLPPRAVRKTGDDGFSDLSADRYTAVRLESRIKTLEAKTRHHGAAITSANTCVSICNAAGTFCAAFASYGLGFMQPWVVFTTALATSITLWVDHTKIEVLQQKLNVTINNLHIVNTWWVSLGAGGDTRQNRDRLVREAETFILEEAMRWGATQIKQKKTQEGDKKKPKEANQNVVEGDQLAEVGQTHGLELQGLTGKGLLEAVKNPEAHHSQPVKQALKKLADKGLAPSEASRRSAEKRDPLMERFVKTVWTEADDLRVLKSPCAGVSDSVGNDVLCVLKQPDIRNKLIQGLISRKDRRNLSRWVIKEQLAKLPQLHELTQDFVTRRLLEVVKSACLGCLVSYFLSLEGFLPQGSGTLFTWKEFFCNETEETERMLFTEVLVSELYGMQKTDGVLHLDPVALVNIIRDATIKERFRSWPTVVRKAIRDAADRLWCPSGNSSFSPVAVLLDMTMIEIARLDINEFLDSPNVKVELWATLPKLTASSCKAALMSKEQLIACFPKLVRQRLAMKSHLQLQKYMEVLSLGTPSSRAFAYQHDKYDALIVSKSKYRQKVFHPVDGDPEMRERLLIAVAGLDQVMINRSTKGLLLKKLRVHDVFNEDCGAMLMDFRENDLKFLLSVMQSRIGNSYSSRLIDRVADEVSSFDVRSTISYYDAEKLVSRVPEFKEAEGKLSALPRIELLRILGIRSLVECMQHLSHQQLVDLCESVLTATTRSFPIRLYSHIKSDLPEIFNNPKLKPAFESWSPEFLDSLSHGASGIDTSQLRTHKGSPYDLIGLISSSSEVANVLSIFIKTCKGAGMHNPEIITDIMNIVHSAQKYGGERILSLAFENTYIFINAMGVRGGCDALLATFEKAETRRVATELLLTLETLELHRIHEDVLGFMRPENETQEAVLASLKEVPDANRALCGLILELTIEAPLRIFHELADKCTTFDLRDVITGNSQRNAVVLMLTDLLLSEDAGLVHSTITPPVGSETLYKSTQRWIGRDFLKTNSSIASPFLPGGWKTRVINSVSMLRDEYYSSMCDDLRVLTELQLKIVCEELYLLLSGTISGTVFKQFVTRSDAGMSPNTWALLNSSVVSLRQKMRIEAATVKTIFENFDAEAFALRDEILKEHLLTPVLDNESDRVYVSTLPAEDLKALLFPYIHKYAPPPQSAFIESSRSVTKDAWAKLRGLRSSVAALKSSLTHGEHVHVE